jgi:hypothetical protein
VCCFLFLLLSDGLFCFWWFRLRTPRGVQTITAPRCQNGAASAWWQLLAAGDDRRHRRPVPPAWACTPTTGQDAWWTPRLPLRLTPSRLNDPNTPPFEANPSLTSATSSELKACMARRWVFRKRASATAQRSASL